MILPKVKQVPITIVGRPRDCSKEEAIKMLVLQNQHIKKFSTVNNIKDHITTHYIKPLRNKPTLVQIFASVSSVLDKGFLIFKNKVIRSLLPCKVYDGKQVKGCNKCQQFGHFVKDWSTLGDPKCAKYGEYLRIDSCSSETRNCLNCARNLTDTCHPAFYYKGPSRAFSGRWFRYFSGRDIGKVGFKIAGNGMRYTHGTRNVLNFLVGKQEKYEMIAWCRDK